MHIGLVVSNNGKLAKVIAGDQVGLIRKGKHSILPQIGTKVEFVLEDSGIEVKSFKTVDANASNQLLLDLFEGPELKIFELQEITSPLKDFVKNNMLTYLGWYSYNGRLRFIFK